MAQEFAAPSSPAPAAAYAAPAPVPAEAPVEVKEHSLLARAGAELFGTFFLVLAICGVALYSVGGLGPGVLGVALAGGLAVMAAIAAVGGVSGGHFNPAVTLGAAIGGRTAWINVPVYWISQLIGGILATLALYATIPAAALPVLQQSQLIKEASKSALMGGIANGYGDHSPLAASTNGAFSFELVAALLIEVLVTAIFVGIILGVTDERVNSKLAPVAIGLTLTVAILIAAPFTNASVNPARSTAAAIFAGDWALSQLWLFWVAPLLGAAIAALFYRVFTWKSPVQDDLLGEDAYVLPGGETVSAPAGAAPVAAAAPVEPAAAAPVETAEPVAEPVAPAEAPVAEEARAADAVPDEDVTPDEGQAPKA